MGLQTTPSRVTDTRGMELAVQAKLRSLVPVWLAEPLLILGKLLWASLFAVLILLGIVLSKAIWSDAIPFWRYDALVIYAVSLQILFLLFKLETWDEAKVIILFHLSGTVMEFFKVNAGSWAYPEPGVLKLFSVPLFTGFMYASVGSFIARAIRLFDMRFTPYPPLWMTFVLAAAIYINFFAHHFVTDIRLVLFAATVILFYRTKIRIRIGAHDYWLPMVLAGIFVGFCLWIAENIGTRTGTWAYPGQAWYQWVAWSKMGSWYLLIFVSFVTVTLVFRDELDTPDKRKSP